MTLKIRINLDNAAFEDDHELEETLLRLAKIARHMGKEGFRDYSIMDRNGNSVGECELIDDDGEGE